MKLPVLSAAAGGAWEADLVSALEGEEHGVTIVRRCVDVVDLLAVAAAGQGQAALVSASLRRLDADVIDRLIACEVVPIGVVVRDDSEAEERLRSMGITFLVPADAAAAVVAAVVLEAVAGAAASPVTTRSERMFGTPSTSLAIAPGTGAPAPTAQSVRRGSVIAVWGPAGAPGRTTVAVAVADELARLGAATLLVDADGYGGTIASVLGLLDDSPGLAAACRQAGWSRLDEAALAALSWQVTPRLRVLTGIPIAQRWPELRPAALESVLATARTLADYVVLDCGFCLETDEELSFDTLAPRRNGATLTVLDCADVVIAVGAADPIGVQRLVRGLADLRELELSAPIWVVVNKMRRVVIPGDPRAELTAALERFAGAVPAALLPHDQAALDAALATGRTLGEVRPSSALRKAAAELAAALAGTPAPSRHRARGGSTPAR